MANTLNYLDYNLETREETPFLGHVAQPGTGAPGRTGANKVDQLLSAIGDDDRLKVDHRNFNTYPWCAICRLQLVAQNGSEYIGTGWLAYSRLVITAAHNLFKPDALGGYTKAISVRPGCMDGKDLVPPLAAQRILVTDQWKSRQRPDDDIGGIVLPNAIDHLGWFAYDVSGAHARQGDRVTICGYPQDSPEHPMQHSEAIVKIDPGSLWYKVDTMPGQSGAPIWMDIPGSEMKMVVGIHTNDETLAPSHLGEVNRGTRISSRVAELITRWARSI